MPLRLDRPDLSVIVPLYDEGDNVGALYRELDDSLRRLGRSYEIVFVDDGSHDSTFDQLRLIGMADPWVKVVRLSRNFGQTAAMQAGFEYSRGRILITLDGDLQNDPADFPRLLEEIEQGYDMVVGWRRRRRDKWLSRQLPSTLGNWAIRRATGVELHDSGCALKAFRRGLVRQIPLTADQHRYMPIFMALAGASFREIEVHHRPRHRGSSKYGLTRWWRVVLDLMILAMLGRFTTRPALWFGVLALPFLFLSILTLGFSVAHYLGTTGDSVPVILPTATLLLAFACAHLALMGMIGELVVWTGDYREGRLPLHEDPPPGLRPSALPRPPSSPVVRT